MLPGELKVLAFLAQVAFQQPHTHFFGALCCNCQHLTVSAKQPLLPSLFCQIQLVPCPVLDSFGLADMHAIALRGLSRNQLPSHLSQFAPIFTRLSALVFRQTYELLSFQLLLLRPAFVAQMALLMNDRSTSFR